MGIQNIVDGDGIGLAITGMLIVFTGLIVISLYIASLPRLLGWMDARMQMRLARSTPPAPEPASVADDLALVAAIAMVLQMERDFERVQDAQRITIQRDDAQDVWALAGKMRTLSKRM
jgi:hypothetical protein